MLPLPPGTSLVFGMPPSSLYCTQKSVSRISAAAANLIRAASPFVSLPLFSSGPCFAQIGVSLNPTPRAAVPAANAPFFKNERRFALRPFVSLLCSIALLPLRQHLYPAPDLTCA